MNSTNLTPEQIAFYFGFRASAAGRAKTVNPHLQSGEIDWRPSSPLGDAWYTGWLHGQGKRECDVSWHLLAFRGNT